MLFSTQAFSGILIPWTLDSAHPALLILASPQDIAILFDLAGLKPAARISRQILWIRDNPWNLISIYPFTS